MNTSTRHLITIAHISCFAFLLTCCKNSDQRSLLDQELSTVYPVPDLLRTSTLESDLQFIELYDAGSFEKAFDTFANIRPSAHSEFYKGLTLIHQSSPSYSKAIGYLSDDMIKGSVYEQPARYYLALLHLQVGSKEKGISLLEQIKANNYHFRRAEALEILKDHTD